MPPLKTGQRHSVQIEVLTEGERARIQMSLSDGSKPREVTWSGQISALSLIHRDFSLGDSDLFGLAAWEAIVDFHQLQVRVTSGRVEPTRPK